MDEVDPEILKTYNKLGIPLEEQKMLAGVAVDAVFDSVSIATTFKEELAKAGVIFCSFSEAVRKYPELVKKYLGSVVNNKKPVDKVELELNSKAKAFRKYLGQNLRIKFTPQLKFFYDDTNSYIQKIENIFHNIESKE